MKAFLGMGLLGSSFVKAMLRRGENVQVWNRTLSKAEALVPEGAAVFSYPADAVKGATHIHLALKDDASVDEVLQAAIPGLAPGAILIDHTTTTKEGAIKRTKKWKEKGFFYQHAPVFMGPANALEGSGFMLLSGEKEQIETIAPELAPMTGKLMHLGPEVGKAAAIKLAGNAFLVCFTASLRETLGVAQSLGLSSTDLSSLFTDWNPGAQILPRLGRMTAGNYSNPSWELAMARKDTGLFLQAAETSGTPLSLLPVIAEVMDSWIQKGHGNEDWVVIGKDFL